jgi:ribulose 1,5-bisphosphate carboxylase large subunit-like protein
LTNIAKYAQIIVANYVCVGWQQWRIFTRLFQQQSIHVILMHTTEQHAITSVLFFAGASLALWRMARMEDMEAHSSCCGVPP